MLVAVKGEDVIMKISKYVVMHVNKNVDIEEAENDN